MYNASKDLLNIITHKIPIIVLVITGAIKILNNCIFLEYLDC